MKWFLLACAAFAFNVSSPVQAEDFDLQADQHILDRAERSEFCNVVIQYPFEGADYPIRIVHNPEKKPVWDKSWKVPSNVLLMLIGDLPYLLAKHVEELVLSFYKGGERPYLSLSGRNALKEWEALHPLHIADRIDDPVSDDLARQTFSSSTFVNRVLYYRLDGRYYQVRLLYNPEGRTLSAAKIFDLPGLGKTPYTFSWNYQYGIFADRYGNPALVDHLAALTPASTWAWYFNFDINRGSNLEYEVDDTSYDLDTPFEFAETFK